ncbi:ZIP family metal transporter [Candidatus Saccharibacteria bacterium]|nr:ZIP family metal transporter [Candidatus Saccharibacteria bacterium]
MELLLLLLVSTLTALLSLIGGFFLLRKSKVSDFLLKIGHPLAATILVFCIFFDLLPEALEDHTISGYKAVALVLVGCLGCFLVNYLLRNFHRHGEEKTLHNTAEAYSMLLVDSLHTLADGVVLGVAFAASPETGLLTAVSTVAHEIPQEIGDFSIMLRSKLKKPKILKLELACSFLIVPAAVLSFYIGEALLPALPPLLCLVAGFLLYLACEEIFAMIKESKTGSSARVAHGSAPRDSARHH